MYSEVKQEAIPIINIPVTVTNREDKPFLLLRKKVFTAEVIKIICTGAYRNKPILIQPVFSDKIRSLAQMQEKKIIKYDIEKDLYFYLI